MQHTKQALGIAPHEALFKNNKHTQKSLLRHYEELLYIYIYIYIYIRECSSTLYVGMAQGVSFSLYIGIGAKFENTQKSGERRLRTAEYRTVLL